MSQSLRDEFLAQVDTYMITEQRMERIVHTAKNRQRGLMLIMEDVHNPHNLSAIARSCDAFGVQQIAFTLENEELFDPREIGQISSASASKWLDYRIFTAGTRDALTTLKAEGWHIMATWVNPEAHSIYDMDFTQYEQLALMLGNEHGGLSPTAVELADSYLYIPMQGFIQSFNVSVAAAISLFEINRQRRASDKDFTRDTESTRTLIKDFLERG